jgi:hypothetical protein
MPQAHSSIGMDSNTCFLLEQVVWLFRLFAQASVLVRKIAHANYAVRLTSVSR